MGYVRRNILPRPQISRGLHPAMRSRHQAPQRPEAKTSQQRADVNAEICARAQKPPERFPKNVIVNASNPPQIPLGLMTRRPKTRRHVPGPRLLLTWRGRLSVLHTVAEQDERAVRFEPRRVPCGTCRADRRPECRSLWLALNCAARRRER